MNTLTLDQTRKLARALGLPTRSRTTKAQMQAEISGADLNSLTVAQLKASLAILGKPQGGNKAELVARLRNAGVGVGAGAPVAATPAP
ncbi:MAG TPA: SAP domain-containing protein, partial [bacterium]|nr:SAP domain-containing protein [bacterium]